MRPGPPTRYPSRPSAPTAVRPSEHQHRGEPFRARNHSGDVLHAEPPAHLTRGTATAHLIDFDGEARQPPFESRRGVRRQLRGRIAACPLLPPLLRPNVKLCRGRFHKMQVGGRAVPKGTTRRGRPPAPLDGRRSPTAVSRRARRCPLSSRPRTAAKVLDIILVSTNHVDELTTEADHPLSNG